MTLTVRSASVTGAVTAGRALTHAEMDANWAHVIQSANQIFLPSGIGAVARTIQSKERDIVSDFDFMTAAQIADVQAGTETLDVTAAVQAALTAVPSTGGGIYSPSGKRKITAKLTLKAFTHWHGDRTTVTTAGTIFHCTNSNIDMVGIASGDYSLRDIVFYHNSDVGAGTGNILSLGVVGGSIASGGLIDGCRFYTSPQAALAMNWAGDTVITNNGFETCNIAITANTAAGTIADDMRLSNNVFYRNSQDIVASYGVRWSVNNNLFQQTGGPGYASSSSSQIFSGTTGYISFTNNLFDTCAAELKFSGTGLNQFIGNKVFNGKRYGLVLSGATNFNLVVGNTFYNGSQTSANTTDAIVCESTADRSIIVNNIVLAGYRYGVNVTAAGVTNTLIENNSFTSLGTNSISDSGTGTIKRNNQGWTTENNGTGTIVNTTTAITITHGLSATPVAKNITITPTNNPTNNPGNMWVDTITSTQFNVNCRADPGASGLAFGWQAIIL